MKQILRPILRPIHAVGPALGWISLTVQADQRKNKNIFELNIQTWNRKLPWV